MWKIIRYTTKDMLKSKWILFYFGFFFTTTWFLLYLTNDATKGLVSLLNIILMLIPLISLVYSIIHVYNSREFTELLLALPIKRKTLFAGQYISVSSGMALSFALGTGMPFLFFGWQNHAVAGSLTNMLVMGILLTYVFTAIAFLLSMLFDNKIKGFGLGILVWLLLAIVYDGLLMLVMVNFNEYPLEQPILILSMLNPIDLARINILLELDISALMGYTGAVFNKFFGTTGGMLLSLGTLFGWIIVPFIAYLYSSSRKDF